LYSLARRRLKSLLSTDSRRLFLSASRKNARGVSENRDRRRSIHPLVSARQIREGWTGREDPAGLYDGKRDRVREVSGFRDLKLKMRPRG